MTNASMLSKSKLCGFVATRDQARAKAFYRDVLGLRLVSEDQFATVFDANGIMLRVTPVRESRRQHPQRCAALIGSRRKKRVG